MMALNSVVATVRTLYKLNFFVQCQPGAPALGRDLLLDPHNQDFEPYARSP